jgi:hypothetical protein
MAKADLPPGEWWFRFWANSAVVAGLLIAVYAGVEEYRTSDH